MLSLLKRSLVNEDNKTRDRAAISLASLEDAMVNFPYQPPPEDAKVGEVPPNNPAKDDTAAYVLLENLPTRFDKLEDSLKMYMQAPMAMESPEPITIQALPIMEDTVAETKASANAAA
jgi:coatomer protein complex subunit gamma